MRTFIYEYISGGGLAGHDLPASLAREGRAMLHAVAHDMAQIPDLTVLTTLDPRLLDTCAAALREKLTDEQARRIHIHPLGPGNEPDTFLALATQSDWTLVIAPETDGVLAERCRWVERAGGRLLGPSPSAVQLAADKFALSEHLRRHGVPAVPGRLVRPAQGLPDDFRYPAVLKPRFGAGSQQTFLIRDATSATDIAQAAVREGLTDNAILQPYIPGTPASVSFLIGPRATVPLLPATQRLSPDGRFRYEGGRLPLPEPLRSRAVTLARRAVDAVPGFLGYVGVDLILAADEPHGERRDVVVEINPRLTTSYVGLRALAETNLAAAMLDIAAGKLPLLRWKPGSVTFDAGGHVTLETDLRCESSA